MNRPKGNSSQIVIDLASRKLAALEVAGTLPALSVRRFAKQKEAPGFEHGLVTHLDRAATSLDALIEALLGTSSPSDVSAYVVLGNAKLKSYGFSSSQYYQGTHRTISAHEIRSVINQTKSVATLPLSEYVLQAIPESFLVNDMPGVKQPLGLEANRLGVNLNLFSMSFQEFKNIARAFEAAEIEVKGFFPRTLAVSEAVLTDEEKKTGVILMDIAQDHTQLALWKDGNFVDVKAILPGASYLASEIAAKWEIELTDAEKVREQFGSFEPPSRFGEELIPLVERNGHGNHQIHRRDFQQSFLDQSKTWLDQILAEVDQFAQANRVLHPYYVITGEGADLDGFLEFLQGKFSRQARIGLAKKIEAPHELLVDPSLTAGLGMVRWLATHGIEHEKIFSPHGILERTLATTRSWFSSYF